MCRCAGRQTIGAARKEKSSQIRLYRGSRAIISGADGRSRTGMEVIRRILSAVRLPIPPHRHIGKLIFTYNAFLIIISCNLNVKKGNLKGIL